MKKIIYFSLAEIDTVVDFLYQLKDTYSIFAFVGILGSGKTTIIRELLKRFGINRPITSPTFNYVNVYRNKKGQVFYHFDLYRLEDPGEFFQQGFDELMEEKYSWSFVEWPEIIDSFLQDRACWVKVEVLDDTMRKVTISDEK